MTENKPKPLKLQCPSCQATVWWNNDFPHRPFCSKRCQLVDFGEWASEGYRVGGDDAEPPPEDEDQYN
jgi:hypothetical protein